MRWWLWFFCDGMLKMACGFVALAIVQFFVGRHYPTDPPYMWMIAGSFLGLWAWVHSNGHDTFHLKRLFEID